MFGEGAAQTAFGSGTTGFFGHPPSTLTGTGNPPFQPFRVEEHAFDKGYAWNETGYSFF